jgi:UDP-N-acetylmuramoylalanine--D-glutamate ligase
MSAHTILILGAGISGLAMARWCASTPGARVVVADTRESACAAAQTALGNEVEVRCETLSSALAAAVAPQAVYLSPGLSPSQLAPVVLWCAQHDVAVGNEVDLFEQGLRDHQPDHLPRPKVLAITGTNGKTTVTALTTHLLQAVGLDAVAAGNIAPALLDALSACIAEQRWPQVWVLELSSFQLHGCAQFQPDIATVLNISDDHLDWHADRAAYAAAKARVFGAHTHRLLNRADAGVMAMQPPESAAKSRRRKATEDTPARWSSFGLDLPQRAGDWGIESLNGMAWLVRARGMDSASINPHDEEDLYWQRLMPAEALRIRGQHNWANALAALALASHVSHDVAGMLYGLRDYAGEPHRVQPVGVIGGVEYFNDSKGTNVGATLAALNGLGHERRLVVILGGEGKGQDFGPLRAPLVRCARAVACIGKDGATVAHTLQGCAFAQATLPSLEAAVQWASEHAQSGDAVLLSPACSSLDMFDNYAHRGRVFTQSVAAIAQEQGVAL